MWQWWRRLVSWLRWQWTYQLVKRGIKVRVAERASRVTSAHMPHPVGTPWWKKYQDDAPADVVE